MNKPSPTPSGRILRHGQRADGVTVESIEARARELALIDGRPASQVTDADRELGRSELNGELIPVPTLQDAEPSAHLTRDPGEPVTETGSQTPMLNEPDDQVVAERLVLEGVEEAQHDQMLAARHEERRHP